MRWCLVVWSGVCRKAPGLAPGQHLGSHIIILHKHEVIHSSGPKSLVSFGTVGLQSVSARHSSMHGTALHSCWKLSWNLKPPMCMLRNDRVKHTPQLHTHRHVKFFQNLKVQLNPHHTPQPCDWPGYLYSRAGFHAIGSLLLPDAACACLCQPPIWLKGTSQVPRPSGSQTSHLGDHILHSM